MQIPPKTKTGALVRIALMAALMAVLAPVTIPVGPVPVTLALLVVFFIGAMLPPVPALAAVSVYILLGVVGLPVFSGYQGGPQVLVGPTGGYIAGYYVIILALSHTARRSQNYFVLLGAALSGQAGCYLVGTLWYMFIMKAALLPALSACVVPFIIPDILKAAAALALALTLRRRLPSQSLF